MPDRTEAALYPAAGTAGVCLYGLDGCCRGQTEYLNSRAADPRRIEVRGAFGLVVTVYAQCKTEVITALADGGIEQQLRTVQGVRSVAVLDKLVTLEGELVFAKPPAAVLEITGNAAVREVKLLTGKELVAFQLIT